MNRFLLKTEVEAHMSLSEGVKRLRFAHPNGLYEIVLEDLDVKAGVRQPLLTAYTVFDAVDLVTAATEGPEHLRRFLEFLSFATGCLFRTVRIVAVFDWSPDIRLREGFIYRNFPNPDFPVPLLSESLARNVEILLGSDPPMAVLRSLRWFADGVCARSPEEQFQFFWFAIETIAQHTKETEPLPDRCSRCREPLYCVRCQETSTHRPYASQAIEQVFHRHVSDNPDRAFKAASTARHTLLHGDPTSRVEDETGIRFPVLVDVVAKVAWAALLTTIKLEGGLNKKPRALRLLQPNTFLHFGVASKIQVGFNSPADRAVDFSDIPGINVDLIVPDSTQAKNDDGRSS